MKVMPLLVAPMLIVSCAPNSLAPATRTNPASLAKAIEVPYDYSAPEVPAACEVWFAQQKLGKTRQYYRGGFVVAGGDPKALSLKLDSAVQLTFGTRTNTKAWSSRTTKDKNLFMTKSWGASGRYWRNMNVIIVKQDEADPAVCIQATS